RSRTSSARPAGCSASASDRGNPRSRATPPARLSLRMATCYRHPSRETGVSCSNCGRPICPDCMTSTPVGMRCPECARQKTTVKRLRDVAAVPRVTYALIAANVIAYLTEQGQFTVSHAAYGTVVYEGELFRAAISEGHQYWRLVSSAFLHQNLLHIGFNMYLLYVLGMMLEPAIGSARFAAIYTVALLAGTSVGAHVGGLIGGAPAAYAVRTADGRRMPALGFIACLVLAVAAVAASLLVAKATGSGIA